MWTCGQFREPAAPACRRLVVLVLGSNDPNTIPDLAQIRYSRFCMLHYVSARTPFLFGLRYIYVSSGLHDFPVTFSRDFVDICFMFPLHYSLCFPRAHYVFFSLSRTPQFPLNPILLYFAYTTQISYSSPAPAHPLVGIYISCTCTLTGGEGQYTQWVHCELIVGSETIRPAHTQQVNSGHI